MAASMLVIAWHFYPKKQQMVPKYNTIHQNQNILF